MQTLRFSILLFLALLLAFTLSAHARTWTAKSGHTMEGDFVKVDGENVVIKLADGNSATVKLDLLSNADQQFAQEEEQKRTNPFVIIENKDNPFVINTTQTDTPEDDPQTFRDKEYGFRFRYPTDWSIHPDPASMNAYAAAGGQPDGEVAPNVTILVQPLDEDVLNTKKEDILKELEEGGMQNIKTIEFAPKKFGGKDSLCVHIQVILGEGAAKGVRLEHLQFLFLHKEKTFVITFTDSQANFNKNRPLFDAVIDSFKFD